MCRVTKGFVHGSAEVKHHADAGADPDHPGADADQGRAGGVGKKVGGSCISPYRIYTHTYSISLCNIILRDLYTLVQQLNIYLHSY